MTPTSESIEVTLAEGAGGAESDLASQFGIRSAPRDPDSWQFVGRGSALALVTPLTQGPMRAEVRDPAGTLVRRLRSVRPSDPLGRAAGLGGRKKTARIVDATAGLARDAMTLAVLGAQVTAIERVPALALLAALRVGEAGLDGRLRVCLGDARERLTALAVGPVEERPDVVYLDPMFWGEEADKRAQVKKDMQICRLLAGPAEDEHGLFDVASKAATDRVVVKRHPDLPPLAPDPAHSVTGERVRFDVYLVSPPPPSPPATGR